MKKVLAVFAFAAMSAMAADFNGFIADNKCAADPAKDLRWKPWSSQAS